MSTVIPYISPDDIRYRAEELLRQHHEEASIPIPIEEIIEFGFEIEIRPMRALKARFQFEGAISHDLGTILVDEEVMQRYPNRYRFTLAHELAHRDLHGDFIRSLVVNDRSDWRTAVREIDPKSYGYMEQQAYIMAGHLLVPSVALTSLCEEARETGRQHGVDLDAMGATAISYVAGNLAKSLRVSTEVVERRLRAEHSFGEIT